MPESRWQESEQSYASVFLELLQAEHLSMSSPGVPWEPPMGSQECRGAWGSFTVSLVGKGATWIEFYFRVGAAVCGVSAVSLICSAPLRTADSLAINDSGVCGSSDDQQGSSAYIFPVHQSLYLLGLISIDDTVYAGCFFPSL